MAVSESSGPHRTPFAVPSPHLFTSGDCYFNLDEIVAVAQGGNTTFPYVVTFKGGIERRYSKDTGQEILKALKIYYERY